jgi:hypothetical protein
MIQSVIQGATMQERRISKRTPTRTAGVIRFGLGRDVECTLRNISGDGACLVLAYRRTVLPPKFSLDLESEWSGRACKLVWRSGFRAGVRFLKPKS